MMTPTQIRRIPLIVATFLMPAAMVAEPLPPIDAASFNAPVRVACVGDSITQGSGAENGKSYPTQLQGLLGESWVVGNFGVSGRTLLKKGDFPYWKEAAYQKALAFKPKLLPDRVHPNAEGAGEMAKAAFKVLTGKPAPEVAAP